MTGRTYEKPLHLDMDFGEALERFGRTEVSELPDNVKLHRKRSGGTKPPAGKSGSKGGDGRGRKRQPKPSSSSG